MKKFLLTSLMMISIISAFSQTVIKGKVSDANNTPIMGANIIIKNSDFGAVTDFEGNFTFTTSLTGQQTLQVSYVGFDTFEQSIDCNNSEVNINVVLQEGENALETVVLTASSTFRSQKETPMSISSVSSCRYFSNVACLMRSGVCVYALRSLVPL